MMLPPMDENQDLLYVDDEGGIKMANDEFSSRRTRRHIEIIIHYIMRDPVHGDIVRGQYAKSREQHAD